MNLEKTSWVDERYEKHYQIVRWILTIGMAILAILVLQDEDLVIAMRLTVLFVIATWLISYPTSTFSMKMIHYADERDGTGKKVFFYLAVLGAMFFIWYIAMKVLLGIWVLVMGMGSIDSFIIACIIISIALFLPWLQSMLVLIMRKWLLKTEA